MYLNYSGYFSHLGCYFNNVSADATTDLIQVHLIELRNLKRSLNKTLNLIHEFDIKISELGAPEESQKLWPQHCANNMQDENKPKKQINNNNNNNNLK